MSGLTEDENSGWRLNRLVRRIARRAVLLDCRQCARRWRRSKGFFLDLQTGIFVGVDGLPTLMHPDRIATVRVDE